MPSAELRVPSDAGYVGLVRLVIAQAARQAGMADERIEDLKLAITEALGTAMRAQTAAGKRPSVRISFGRTDDAFEVAIGGLNLRSQAASRAFGVDQPGAGSEFWITLINGLADDVGFAPNGEGVELRFAVSLGSSD